MNWQERLIDANSVSFPNMEEVYEESYATKEKDIGLVHPETGAGLLIRRDKKMECFADYGLGFKFDPDTKSLSIYASNIKLHANKIQQMNYDEAATFSEEYEEIKTILNNK